MPSAVQMRYPYCSLDPSGTACLKISWDDPSSPSVKITSYSVWYALSQQDSSDPTEPWTPIPLTVARACTTGCPKFSLTGLGFGNYYVIKVRAISVNGPGPFSSIINKKSTSDIDVYGLLCVCLCVHVCLLLKVYSVYSLCVPMYAASKCGKYTQKEGTIGVALVFVNEYPRGLQIKGSNIDANYLGNVKQVVEKWENLLVGCKFHVNVHTNQTGEQIKGYIYELSLTTKNQPLVAIFCGHGSASYVYGDDGSAVHIKEDIIRALVGNQGKEDCQKFIFIDACRTKDSTDGSNYRHEMDKCLLPLDECRNYLVAYSTVLGYSSPCGPVGPRWSNCVIEQLKKERSVEVALSNAHLELKKKGHPTGEYQCNLLGSAMFPYDPPKK